MFAEPDPAGHGELDAAYHAKYDHYDASIVAPVAGAVATSATLRVIPA